MKITLALIAALVVVGGLSAYLPGKLAQAKNGDPFANVRHTVKRGELRLTVTENGYLKAKNSKHLVPEYDGENKITFLIDEGSEVKEGDVLISFDSTNLETRLEESKSQLIQYEAELEASKANRVIQERDNEAAIEKANLNLEIAQLTLKRYEDGEKTNNERQKELAVQKSQSELDRALEAYEQVPSLVSEGFLTKIQAEEERFRLEEAKINLENAQRDLELYRTLTVPMELRQKQAAVREAERAQLTAKERAEIALKEKDARVSQHQRQLDSTKNRIKELEKSLGYMEIKAPHGGIALHGDPARPWYKDNIKLGNTVWNGMTVITLPDLAVMQVLVDIHEADIDLVENGQPCSITLDTYRGQVFKGEVTDVAKVASNGRFGDSTNKQFRVEVTMEESEVKLRAGVTAKVEILIDVLEDVVQVPVHAVFKDGDEYVCFTPDGDGFGRKVVEIGKSNAFSVEVTAGLEPGDEVLLLDPREDTAESETGDGEEGGFSAPGTGGDAGE